MIKKIIVLLSMVFLMVFGLTACGGSGGGSSSSDPNRLTEDQVTRIVAELNGTQVNASSLDDGLRPFADTDAAE